MKRLIATGLLSAAATTVLAQTPIKIGEINSYSAIPQFTQPYKQGWQLAVEEINAQGGLLGRKVEVIARDDAGKPTRVCGTTTLDQLQCPIDLIGTIDIHTDGAHRIKV